MSTILTSKVTSRLNITGKYKGTSSSLDSGGGEIPGELPKPKNGKKKDHHTKDRVRGAMSVLFVICCPGSYCYIQIFISLLSFEAPQSLLKMAILFLGRHWSWTMSIFQDKMNCLVISEDSHAKLDHMWQ